MMKISQTNIIWRRKFLKSVATGIALIPGMLSRAAVPGYGTVRLVNQPKLKLSLNAYSFNEPLRSGKMTLEDLLQFCAEKNFLGADLTGYYFPGYPSVPSDEYLYHIKRKAFSLGVEISGTGVRNDFAEPDSGKRRESVQLVKDWILAAEKMGAPVIRIFAGHVDVSNLPREKVLQWMINDIKECVEFGKAHGVVVAVQNHNDFIKTADEAIGIMEAVPSEWFGLILDTGSYRSGDPYEQIAKTVKYAVNWQIKERIYVNGKETDIDLDKLFAIIKASGYRGYIPLETLGEGDPKIKVSSFLEKVNQALERSGLK